MDWKYLCTVPFLLGKQCGQKSHSGHFLLDCFCQIGLLVSQSCLIDGNFSGKVGGDDFHLFQQGEVCVGWVFVTVIVQEEGEKL
jgi:hypothetical protein